MSRAERRAQERTQKKSFSWRVWLYVVLVLVLISGIIVYNNLKPTGVDYSKFPELDSAYTRTNATHTIEVFSDFECPACQAVAPQIETFRDISVNTQIIYKYFPLRSIHPDAEVAAEAAECAREQVRFWAYHDVLFSSKLIDARSLRKHAQGLGLDMTKWQSCMDEGRAVLAVQHDYLEGTQRGVQGTPTFFIDGKVSNARTVAEFTQATQ